MILPRRRIPLPFARALAAAIGLMLAVSVVSDSARADWGDAYAAVVCKDNRALVRFSWAWNGAAPKFVRGDPLEVRGDPYFESEPIDRELDQLVPDDPSRCTLSDSREIVLRQGSLGDGGLAYGMCGAPDTEVFSLWIAGRKIYSREPFIPKCGFPHQITEILLDGDRLTECSAPKDSGASAPDPVECVDQSERLRHEIVGDVDDGKMVLIRSASSRETLCRGLVRQVPRRELAWPAYAAAREVVEDSDDGLDTSGWTRFDFDNDGKPERVILWEGTGPGTDFSLWAVLAADASEEQVAAVKAALSHGDVSSLRRSGIRVHAGDQTAYGGMNRVHMTVFRRDGTTLLHAWVIGPKPPEGESDLILRPMPGGDLEEVCAFRLNPAL